MKDVEVPSSLYSNILTDGDGDLMYCTILKIYEKYSASEEVPCEFTMEIVDMPLPALSPKTSLKQTNRNSPLTTLEPPSPTSFSFYEPGQVLLPKGLVIVSKQPMFATFQKILLGLYKLSKRRLSLPMECYISHMVMQIPLPSRGHVSIRYLLENYAFPISLPPCNRLPILDMNLGTLFHLLDLDTLFILFRNILLEKSTVFVSNSEENLMRCTYGIIGLLFPFHWNMVYVPNLPINLLDFLYSPVTFIFGVNSKYIAEIYSRVNDSTCIIDLDNNRFLVSDIPTFHRKASANVVLPKLPEHYGKKLRKSVLGTLAKAGVVKGKLVRLAKPDLDESQTQQIRSHFFQFFVSILKDYKKHIIYEQKDSHGSTFNSAAFIAACSDKDFMNRFVETQMFSNFCESRIRPKNVEEHCEGLYFDEEITAKDNRSSLVMTKTPVTFINDTSQEHRSVHTVPAISTIFQSPQKYAYAQFPNFNISVLSEFPLPETKPPKFAENIVKVNKVLPNWRTDAECLLTTWLDLWGFFIHCQDPSDFSLRVQELISVAEMLQRCTHLPTISIYKSLLERCFLTNPSLALPIFSFMSSSKIAIDAETLQLLQKIVSKLYATDQSIVIQNTGTNVLITQNTLPQSQESKIKRVFTKPEDANVFAKQEVSFVIKELCKNCGRLLKVDELVQGWSKISYKFETACTACGEKILPKLSVRVGLEIGFYKEQPTSTNEETLFISVHALRQLVNDLMASQKELSLHSFRAGYQMIFWNAIWHFNQKNLPFEFLLMYEQNEVSSDLLLTTSALKTYWSFEVADCSTQTDVTMHDIEQAEAKNQRGFEEMIRTMIFV